LPTFGGSRIHLGLAFGIIALIAYSFVLFRTRWGLEMRAIGNNPEAAQRNGIPIARYIVLLMFIGGASGSTAGGVKVNTFGVLVATALSSLRGKEHAGAFGREFAAENIHRALALVMLYLGLAAAVVLALSITEESGF
jgi:predicted ABC-type sugar transport system permease subunit